MPNMLDRFPGHEATVAAAARAMKRFGLTPDDVLSEYERWRAAREKEVWSAGHSSPSPLNDNSSLHSPHSTLKKPPRPPGRHKVGDLERLPDACPVCGAAVEIYQLCHISSPLWRTQLACMEDGCAWHGKSRLPIDALIALGVADLKNHVTEG